MSQTLKRGEGYSVAEKRAIWDAYQRQIAEFGKANWSILGRELGHNRQAIQRAVAQMLREASEPPETPKPAPEIPPPPLQPMTREDLIGALRKTPLTLDDLAQRFDRTRGAILDEIDAAKRAGANVHQFGDRYSIEKGMIIGSSSHADASHFDLTATNGEYLIGVVGDSHLGSKYERLDVLNDLYDIYKAEGVTKVYHCGNWIEGEARFNKFDISVYGLDAQIRHFIENYPQRDGITTYYVAGDDHEGWYAQREGVDIGRYLELRARELGRNDLVYLGYMESFINLQHDRTGETAKMLVCHPGGGSSYADSYVIQKIIESYEGGEKPGVAFYGHYHKMLSGEYRNVWWTQVGCGKDQDPFARKKRLRYVVGGILASFKQHESGYIPRFRAEMLRYFSRGFHQNLWSHSGPVNKPPMNTVGHFWEK